MFNLSLCPQSDMHKHKAPMPQLPSIVVDDHFGKDVVSSVNDIDNDEYSE